MEHYRRRVAEAEAFSQEGRESDAADALRAALGLWKGEALEGLPSPALRNKAVRLGEERMNTVELYVGTELALGNHLRMVTELRSLVDEHPYRERLRAQFMLALYRSGRRAEALEAFRTGREQLVKDLGIEPGAELQGMEQAVLRGGPELDAPRGPHGGFTAPEGAERAPAVSAPPPPPRVEPERAPPSPFPRVAPCQLPSDLGDVLAPPELLAAVHEAAVGGDSHSAVRVVVIAGGAGCGKSATAIHLAHRLAREHFVDGQVYCDMRGMSGEPVDPADVLLGFLRAFGVPAQEIPDSPARRAAIFRGLLAGRRVLVVLDDAASIAQVRPLLPGSGTCAVLITSRARLSGLPCSRIFELGAFAPAQAMGFLESALGAERVAGGRGAAAALVDAVDGHPLALRIISDRLNARPHWSIGALHGRLADPRRCLDELSHGELDLRSRLRSGYDALSDREQRAFRLLSITDGENIPVWADGALTGITDTPPGDMSERLVDVGLLGVAGTDGAGHARYRLSKVARLYGRELLREQEPGEERKHAVERLAGGWLTAVDEAGRRLLGGASPIPREGAARYPLPASYLEDALGDPALYLERERPALRSAIALAADGGAAGACWNLAVALAPFLREHRRLSEWESINDIALVAALRSGDRRGQAALLFSRGMLLCARGRRRKAVRTVGRALAVFVELGDSPWASACRAWLEREDRGRKKKAAERPDAAQVVFSRVRPCGDARGRTVGRPFPSPLSRGPAVPAPRGAGTAVGGSARAERPHVGPDGLDVV
nr:BTAD domain-containing putative transcriptional regulator [Nocardiopsis potens]